MGFKQEFMKKECKAINFEINYIIQYALDRISTSKIEICLKRFLQLQY